MNLLIVSTSHEELGSTGYQTGVWLEDFAAAYYAFRDSGADLTLASPKGGSPPIDPRSIAAGASVPLVVRLRADPTARALLSDTVRLDKIDAQDFDGAYFPGATVHCGTLPRILTVTMQLSIFSPPASRWL
jgi:putative intracellular protease/amidase